MAAKHRNAYMTPYLDVFRWEEERKKGKLKEEQRERKLRSGLPYVFFFFNNIIMITVNVYGNLLGANCIKYFISTTQPHEGGTLTSTLK